MVELGLTSVGVGTVAILLGVSAFFSSSEIAIFSLESGWLDGRAAAGDRRAVALKRLRDDPHRLLVTILVGNNVVNVAISSIVTVVLVAHLPPGLAALGATVGASLTVTVFGEIVPKSYGLGNAERWSLVAARPLQLVELSLLPLVVALDVLTRWLGSLLGGQVEIEEPYVDDLEA